jgi:hypothetical protein
LESRGKSDVPLSRIEILESSKESDDRNEETEAARVAFDELAAMVRRVLQPNTNF